MNKHISFLLVCSAHEEIIRDVYTDVDGFDPAGLAVVMATGCCCLFIYEVRPREGKKRQSLQTFQVLDTLNDLRLGSV